MEISYGMISRKDMSGEWWVAEEWNGKRCEICEVVIVAMKIYASR